MTNPFPDIETILQRSVKLMDSVIGDSEHISAIAHDNNDELTTLAASLWFMSSQGKDTQDFPAIIKMHVMTAFYLGYCAGQKEGDLTIWEDI